MSTQLRPNAQRAKNAIILLLIVMILDIASLISGYLQYNLLQNIVNGVEVSEAAADANDNREQLIALIYMVAYIISAFTFIMWFRRAYYNLHQKLDYLNHPEGWAAGAWFVPVVNLYRPYQIMQELYEETQGLLQKNEINSGRYLSSDTLGWWWGLWILTNIVAQIAFRMSTNAQLPQDYINMTAVQMASDFLSIPLALLAIKVVSDYARFEPYLLEIQDPEEPTETDQDYQAE